MRSGGICIYCQRVTVISRNLGSNGAVSRKVAGLCQTKDHKHPKSKGGTETAICCLACNAVKLDLTMDEWQQVMNVVPLWWLRYERKQSIGARLYLDLVKAGAISFDAIL
jgi:hypothetical protein